MKASNKMEERKKQPTVGLSRFKTKWCAQTLASTFDLWKKAEKHENGKKNKTVLKLVNFVAIQTFTNIFWYDRVSIELRD